MRPLSEEESRVIEKVVRLRTASVRLVTRAKIVQLASRKKTIPQIIHELKLAPNTVRKWFKRFEEQGLAELEDEVRPRAPARYSPEVKALVDRLLHHGEVFYLRGNSYRMRGKEAVALAAPSSPHQS